MSQCLVHAPDFNSSDVEPDEIPETTHRFWQASLNKIIKQAFEDRLSSKRAVKGLEFYRGSPHNIRIQKLWVARFEAFRHHTLTQDTRNPFTGDDLIWFFELIIGKWPDYSNSKTKALF